MSKLDKAIDRLKSKPTDFSWDELLVIMNHFGYREHKNTGSGRKFIHPETKLQLRLHKPHPSGILKRYQVDDAFDHLHNAGLI